MINENAKTNDNDNCDDYGSRLARFTDEEYDLAFASYSSSSSNSGTTPRPGMESNDLHERQVAAKQAILSFSQVAKHAAAASKRRYSLKSRTDYCLINKHVIRAFNELETQIQKNPAVMSQSDFNILKKAISNLRVKLIVRDTITFDELKQIQKRTKKEEEIAEKATYDAFMDNTPNKDPQQYLDAKNKYLDIKAWGAELAKEIRRVSPACCDLLSSAAGISNGNGNGNVNYYGMKQTTSNVQFQVPSQHAHIAHSTGVLLRNILSPETIRRTFISLQVLTRSIRDELVAFLINAERHKDRHVVIAQIKESMKAKAKAKTATTTTTQH